jgi:uncharacterized protein YodC (DUF2158 family)
MSEEYKPGDVVQLKSGGSKMVVRVIDEDLEEVHCDWHDKNKPYSENYHPTQLKLADEEPRPSVEKDDLLPYIWIVALGKSLIKKKSLDKTDLIAELSSIKNSSGMPTLMQAELQNMIDAALKW